MLPPITFYLIVSSMRKGIKNLLRRSHNPLELSALQLHQEWIRGEPVVKASHQGLNAVNQQLHCLRCAAHYFSVSLLFPVLYMFVRIGSHVRLFKSFQVTYVAGHAFAKGANSHFDPVHLLLESGAGLEVLGNRGNHHKEH